RGPLPTGERENDWWALRAVITRFRLLVTEPLDGAANMALDEALLLSRLRHQGPPTLRFFAWAPPTVSLGYGQRLDGRIDLDEARALGIGLVRRQTGGSAILHEGPDLEITYSVAASAGDFEGAGDLLETYRWIGAGLSAGLSQAHGLALEGGELSAEETELAGSLARDKYGTHDWTWSGRAPRALTIV